MKRTLPFLTLFFYALNSYSQSDTLKNFPFQFTIVSPISTSGNNSFQYNYNFSISAISGKSGGINGFEVAGISNYTKHNVNGFQTSGLVNIVKNKVDGIQIAGLVNKTNGNEGVQIAGIYNKSKIVKGVQIALINFADSVDGYMIGAVNKSAKNGKYAFEFGSSDNFSINARYVSGVKDVYNFISFGLKYKEGMNWAYGFGIGKYLKEKPKHRTFIEFAFHHVTEDKLWENRYANFLLSYGYGFEFKSNRNGNFRVMPTINLYKVHTKDGRLRPYPETNFVYYSAKASGALRDYHIWVGLNLSYKINWGFKS